MENKFIKILSIIFAFLMVQTIHAQKQKNNTSKKSNYYHFVYASIAGGYSSLVENGNADIATYGNFGGLIGVGYEMRVKHFWMSIGGDVEMLQNQSHLKAPYTMQHAALDTQGKKFIMNYEIKKHIDNSRWIYADVPLMLGGYFDMFYFGAGAKIGYPVKNSNSTRIAYSTSGKYSQYIGDFSEMDNHFYGTYDTITYNNIKPRMNIALIGEIGVDVLANVQYESESCQILKIGLYFEYGLQSMVDLSHLNLERVTFPNNNATILTGNSHYRWNSNNSYTCNPYFVGLKITYLYGGKTNQKSLFNRRHKCMCYDN